MTSTSDAPVADEQPQAVTPSATGPVSPFPGMLARAGIVGGAAVAAALVLSAVTLILFVVGSAIIGAGSGTGGTTTTPSTGVGSPFGSSDVAGQILGAGIGVVLEVWIALATSILFSGITASVGAGGAAAGIDLYVVPLLLTAIVFAVTVVAAWIVARYRPATTRRDRLIAAALAGGVGVIVAELIAAIGSVPITVSISIITVSGSVSGLGWRLLLGAFVLVAAATLLGSSIASAAPVGARGPAALVAGTRSLLVRIPSTWRPFVAVVITGIVGWTVLTLVVGIIWSATQGSQAGVLILTAPLWVPTAAFWTAAIGQLGGLLGFPTAASTTTVGSQSMTQTVFSAGPVGIGALVAAVVVALACAVVVRRVHGGGPVPRLGLLALQTAAAWLVLPYLLATVQAQLSGGLGAIAAGSGELIVVAPWTFLLAGLWGLGIDVAARRLVPAWAGSADGDPAARRLRSRTVIGAAVVVALIVAGAIVGTNVVQSNSPEAVANRYVAAIAAGDLKTARAMESNGGAGVRVVPAKGKRMTAARVTAVSSSSSSATYTVSFTVGGQAMQRTLTLNSAASGAFGLPKWVVSNALVNTVTFAAPAISGIDVDGVDYSAVSDSTGGIPVVLYPGSYTAKAAGAASDLFTFDAFSVGTADGSVAAHATLTLANDVQKALAGQIDTCAASTDASPSGCPMSIYLYGTYSGLTWHVDSYPSITVSSDGTTYATRTCGSATATYLLDDGFDPVSTRSTTDSCLSAQGSVTYDGSAVGVTID